MTYPLSIFGDLSKHRLLMMFGGTTILGSDFGEYMIIEHMSLGNEVSIVQNTSTVMEVCERKALLVTGV